MHGPLPLARRGGRDEKRSGFIHDRLREGASGRCARDARGGGCRDIDRCARPADLAPARFFEAPACGRDRGSRDALRSSEGAGHAAGGTPGQPAPRMGSVLGDRRGKLGFRPEAELALHEAAEIAEAAPSCLLCYEADWRVCHRSRIAEILAAAQRVCGAPSHNKSAIVAPWPGKGSPAFEQIFGGRIMRITANRLIAPVLSGFCLLSLPVCAPPGDVPISQAQIPAIAPGMARVWLLRDNDPEEAFGTPIIYANGQPVGRSEPGAAAYRDLPPGTYRFTVQSYGLPTGYKDKVQLAPGIADLSGDPVGPELGGGRCGRFHILCANAVTGIGQGVLRFDAICRPGSNPIVMQDRGDCHEQQDDVLCRVAARHRDRWPASVRRSCRRSKTRSSKCRTGDRR